ncbi:MAG: hypothetical protein QW727_00625 [Candidatus Pacearchaeota archaeon]
MKDKKGFFLGETTVKIVIGILALSVLIYFGIKLYGIFQNNHNLKIAEEHLKNIEEIIKNLKKESKGEKEYILLNPNDWYLAGFELPIMNEIPKKCKSDKCICMCFMDFPEPTNLRDPEFRFGNREAIDPQTGEKIKIIPSHKQLANSCNKIGACIDVNQKFLSVHPKTENQNYYPIIIKKDLIQESQSLNISLNNDKLTITTK